MRATVALLKFPQLTIIRRCAQFQDRICSSGCAGQAQLYGAKLRRGTVEALGRDGNDFVAQISGDECIRAQRVLIASGIEDVAPEIPGLDRALSCSVVRYCPICDGYEALGKRIAVFGEFEHAVREAEFLRTYSKSVTVLYGAADGAQLGQAPAQFGIVIAPAATRSLSCTEFGVKAELANDDVLTFDVLYPAMGCTVRSGLAKTLGTRVDRAGCVRVDQQQRTSIQGLYAAGDVVSDLHQISVAEGHAAIAATAMHNSLPRNFL